MNPSDAYEMKYIFMANNDLMTFYEHFLSDSLLTRHIFQEPMRKIFFKWIFFLFSQLALDVLYIALLDSLSISKGGENS